MDNKFDVKKLIQISLLIAIEVILTRFCSIQTPIVRIGFGFLPIAIIGMMYGPLSAGVAYAIGDLLGVALFPTGSFFPGFTITAFLTGIVYGVFLYNKPKTWPRIIGAVLTVCLVINLGLDTLWLSYVDINEPNNERKGLVSPIANHANVRKYEAATFSLKLSSLLP